MRFELDELPKNFLNCADDQRDGRTRNACRRAHQETKEFRKHWDDITAIENRLDTRHNEIIADLLSGDYEVFKALKLKAVADTIEHTKHDGRIRSFNRVHGDQKT